MPCIYCKSDNIKVENKHQVTVGVNFIVYIETITCLDCKESVDQMMVEESEKNIVTKARSAWENFK